MRTIVISLEPIKDVMPQGVLKGVVTLKKNVGGVGAVLWKSSVSISTEKLNHCVVQLKLM